MKKLFTYLGLVLAACLILVACASNKSAEKKKGRTNFDRTCKADATILIDTMLGKSSNGFKKIDSTVKITKPGLKRMFLKNKLQILSKKRGIHRKKSIRLNTLKAMMPKTPTQVLSKFLKVRRNMIGKIQDYKLKDVKVKGNDATVTFTSRSVSAYGAAAAVRTLLMSLYDNDIDKLKQWNQADNNDVEKGKDRLQRNSFMVALTVI